MSSVRRLYYAFRSSDGRIRIATLLGVSGLVMALAIFLMLPASAGDGDPSGAGVQPTEVSYGGGPGACAVFSDAAFELHINNPMDGTFTGPDGTRVTLEVSDDDVHFNFAFVNNPEKAAFDVVVNGGSKNTHFDYDGSIGARRTDTALHAPTKGGSSNLYNLSHVNICYDVAPLASVSGTKFHDHDADGAKDGSFEPGLGGWTIAAFGPNGIAGTAVTASDGSYSIAGLAPGEYTICEATNTDGLPISTDERVTWAWTQSAPSDNSLCGEGYAPAGHTVTVETSDITGRDFGNLREVSINCSQPDEEGIPVSLGGEGDPLSTVTVPGGCDSGVFTSTYDLGLSSDGDAWRQFVVFGGDPNGAEIIEQVIEWVPEPATYVDGSLLVPTTQVRLTPDGGLQPVVFCDTLEPPGQPNPGTSQCEVKRTIDQSTQGEIQLTEEFLFIGDPPVFR